MSWFTCCSMEINVHVSCFATSCAILHCTYTHLIPSVWPTKSHQINPIHHSRQSTQPRGVDINNAKEPIFCHYTQEATITFSTTTTKKKHSEYKNGEVTDAATWCVGHWRLPGILINATRIIKSRHVGRSSCSRVHRYVYGYRSVVWYWSFKLLSILNDSSKFCLNK